MGARVERNKQGPRSCFSSVGAAGVKCVGKRGLGRGGDPTSLLVQMILVAIIIIIIIIII